VRDGVGTTIASRDIVARKVQNGWRISRASIVGFTDQTRRVPLTACIDFDSHDGKTWHEITDSAELLHIAASTDERAATLIKRVPEITKVLQDYEVSSLRTRIKSV
jgi:hypothetical protein